MHAPRAVFLDKDGTLIEDVPYNGDPSQIRLLPGAGKALQALRKAGYRLILVSNQSGVARGDFPEEALSAVRDRLNQLLSPWVKGLDGFYYCPHLPEAAVPAYACRCECRKPAPGMILRAAEEHGLELEGSWLLGDILDDVEAGRRAGVRTVLIDNGHETEWAFTSDRRPHYVAADLLEAARIITHDAVRDGQDGQGGQNGQNGNGAGGASVEGLDFSQIPLQLPRS